MTPGLRRQGRVAPRVGEKPLLGRRVGSDRDLRLEDALPLLLGEAPVDQRTPGSDENDHPPTMAPTDLATVGAHAVARETPVALRSRANDTWPIPGSIEC